MFLRTRRRVRPRAAALRGGATLLRLLPATDGLLRALPRARVGLGALPVHRQVAPVALPAVRADLLQALDGLRALAPQIAFDLLVLVDVLAELGDLFLRQVADLRVRVQVERGENLARGRLADAVDVGEADLEPLLVRQVDAGDTGHRASTPASACAGGWCR